jgi:hypothetical protein
MFNLVKHLLFEYHTLLMKMTLNASTITFIKCNLCLLTNVETLLDIVHFLIKFAQMCNVCVWLYYNSQNL